MYTRFAVCIVCLTGVQGRCYSFSWGLHGEYLSIYGLREGVLAEGWTAQWPAYYQQSKLQKTTKCFHFLLCSRNTTTTTIFMKSWKIKLTMPDCLKGIVCSNMKTIPTPVPFQICLTEFCTTQKINDLTVCLYNERHDMRVSKWGSLFIFLFFLKINVNLFKIQIGLKQNAHW